MEIEILSTTPKIAADDPVTCMATRQNTVATIPESRLTRTGVPSCGWNLPKKPPKKAPSAAAIACIRSLMIIHAEPCVMRMIAKMTPVTVSMAGAAAP